MTKICPEFEQNIPMDLILPVSADVSFVSDKFPDYKLGPGNQILEQPEKNNQGPSPIEVVEQEATQLSEQHKRLSVRDLASRFDKNLAAASKLSNEVKLREVASLEGHVFLKKLRDALEYLKGRLAGRNKEDVVKAISMVEALAVKLTQDEGELIQEKFEVNKLASFLKQASEDAKKLVNTEKSFACAEIDSARSIVLRIGEALEQQEKNPEASKKKEMEGLMEEVQEARKIRSLHQPSKVMDMEHELHALRTQIRDKCIVSMNLQKELERNKRIEENRASMYVLEGSETLGSCLRLKPRSEGTPQLSKCSVQWYSFSPESNWKQVISGANKSSYAPEPLDVGRILRVEITLNGQKFTVTTIDPIDTAIGLGSYMEALSRKSNSEFNVTISQMNGQDYSSHSVHVLHVGKMRMKLCRGWITKARENYSSSMQVCGFRGDDKAATKVAIWQARKGLCFVLKFESERERNAAIILARKYALDCNVMLAGPEDHL